MLGGDLAGAIEDKISRGEYFEEKLILDWFIQIAEALEEVHKKKIIHRDIKPSNIFLDKYSRVKLGDFGVSSEISSDSTKHAHTVIGTPHYMAPEQCVPSKDKGRIEYSFPVDVWALGVTLYETCALKRPFEGPTPYSIYKLIESAVYHPLPDHYSQPFKTLISKMLHKIPSKRITIHNLIRNFNFISNLLSILEKMIKLLYPKGKKK